MGEAVREKKKGGKKTRRIESIQSSYVMVSAGRHYAMHRHIH